MIIFTFSPGLPIISCMTIVVEIVSVVFFPSTIISLNAVPKQGYVEFQSNNDCCLPRTPTHSMIK